MLTEFQRMRLIGEEFPIPLVAPVVLAKVDAVALAVERAVMWNNDRATKLRDALAEIAELKSLTATPTQFYQHLQRIARRAVSADAMAEPGDG